VAKLPSKNEKISQLTLASSQWYFDITSPICMYELRYNFSFQGFVRKVFWYNFEITSPMVE
jgi:hypothetical protein